jgi:hypothetical protein
MCEHGNEHILIKIAIKRCNNTPTTVDRVNARVVPTLLSVMKRIDNTPTNKIRCRVP